MKDLLRRALPFVSAFACFSSSNLVQAAPACQTPALAQSMPYAKARAMVLSGGWKTPVPPPKGYTEEAADVARTGSRSCELSAKTCTAWPELTDCPGDAQCYAEFFDAAGHRLSISTKGALNADTAEKQKIDAQVASFKVDCTPKAYQHLMNGTRAAD